MKKTSIKAFQLLILALMRLYYIGRVKLDSGDLSEMRGPVIIAANHANQMDPFIIACFLPIKTILKIFPYGFMTANIYYYKWWRPIAYLAGCFPSKPKLDGNDQNTYGVGMARKMTTEGYSIVMFPEGKRTDKRIEARRGISHILENSDIPLLLCRISWDSSRISQKITMVVRPAGTKLNINDPNAIMKAIYDLPIKPNPAVITDNLAKQSAEL